MPKKLNMSGVSNLSPENSSLIARISRLEDLAPQVIRGNAYAGQGRNKFLPLSSGSVLAGKINAVAGVTFKGILAPNVIDGQFTVASPSDSTATIYYDGTNSSRVFVIRRSDDTTTTVPPNNISISGLTHDVQYEAYAFWAPFNACNIGFSAGTTGTPQIAIASTDSDTTAAQAKAEQSLAGREPLGVISWTQPTSGGSSSAGNPTTPPTRQPGTCVRLGTSIEPLGSLRPSELKTLLHKQEKWIHLEAGTFVLDCTPNHPLYHATNGQVRADSLSTDDYVITSHGELKITSADSFIRSCTKMQVEMARGHLFWANGFLSHNNKLDLG